MRINFDHIDSCPIDSYIIDESAEAMRKYFSNPNSFHELGRAAKAENEESRNGFAELLNVQPNELFFVNDSISQTKRLIDYCILILDIEHIVTSKFENVSVLSYLEALEQGKKVKLSFIETNSTGEIDITKFERLLDNDTSTLVSLSHANEHNGLLLPVKDILYNCQINNVLFHLNIKLTIGKYDIDIQKIKADFISFDFSSEYGIKNSGVLFLNQSIKIPDNTFYILRNTLKDDEQINTPSINAIYRTFSNSINNLQKYKEQIMELREYFISKFASNFNLKHMLDSYHKKGLFTTLSYYLTHEQFGNYIAEKLDINKIAVGKTNHPYSNQTKKGEYIRFSFGKGNSIRDIDFLLSKLKELHKENIITNSNIIKP